MRWTLEEEAIVAEAMYRAMRRSSGARFVVRSDDLKSFDNVLIAQGGHGVNLRVLARAAVRSHRRYINEPGLRIGMEHGKKK